MVYDYECKKCGAAVEMYQKRSEDAEGPILCKCGGEMVKTFSPDVSFIFKGSGTFKKGFDGYKPKGNKEKGK